MASNLLLFQSYIAGQLVESLSIAAYGELKSVCRSVRVLLGMGKVA